MMKPSVPSLHTESPHSNFDAEFIPNRSGRLAHELIPPSLSSSGEANAETDRLRKLPSGSGCGLSSFPTSQVGRWTTCFLRIRRQAPPIQLFPSTTCSDPHQSIMTVGSCGAGNRSGARIRSASARPFLTHSCISSRASPRENDTTCTTPSGYLPLAACYLCCRKG